MHAGELPVASPDTPMAQALRILDAGRLGLVAVADAGGRLAGVVSDGDVRRMLARGEYDAHAPVGERMTRDPRRIAAGSKAAWALDIMEQHEITVLPVVGPGGDLAGLVHLHDLLGKGRLKFG
jgi:arabinose-5-phosphate isomerase